MRNLGSHNTKTAHSSTESMNQVLACIGVHNVSMCVCVCVGEKKTEKMNPSEKRDISLKAEGKSVKKKKGKGKKRKGEMERKKGEV